MTTKNLTATAAGNWNLGGDLPVTRMGYGAMQLAGPGVFGPPADRDQALAVLRRAVELGVNHIDTSDFYGPYVVNELIREALHPYADDLVLVTKVGARRDDQAAWLPALAPDELRGAVHDNLGRLGVDRLDLVNLRVGGVHGPEETDIEEPYTVLAELQQQGLIRHLGVSNVTSAQLAQAQGIAPVGCVQNLFNIANQQDSEMVDECAAKGVAYVSFFPLGGFAPIHHDRLGGVAARHGVTERQVALAWLLARSPAMLLIPGTSSVAHLEENIAAGTLALTESDLAELNAAETD
ncbi:oxidoreductase [Solihabitans fulvus]|uniref:Oxidoreductase n=1 Tax=Solihabitans fulvus TaxID=1892852 RepID=A0A5B2XPQ9_9PSEU|nr:oxidoreductase [Solihabitans fulvus]KAA2264871.1 oxidoreductase [Solihabitans fulvus]